MARTVCTYYSSDDIEAEFVAYYGPFDDVSPDVELLSLSILGVKLSLSELPKELRQAILGLQPETV